ncbi:MAG: iron export ABC transporter permease subunit FetB [Methanomicrobiaceae archaeon]|nr:iron export ABC transporter permease subunit FetB [Methanomicrobiaceae archaeon]
MTGELYDPVAGLLNLGIAIVLVAVVIGLLWLKKLGLEKDLAVAVARAVVQLMAMVVIIAFIFETGNLVLVTAMLLFMMAFAARISAERAEKLENPFWVTFPSIAAGSGLIIVILVISGVIPMTAEYIIPLGSMAVGGTMIVCSLVLNRYFAELSSNRSLIEAAMCLGADNEEAILPHIRQSVRASLIPSVDRMKSLGIVILPGAMAGMLIGGVNPLWAAEYQLVIMFMIFSSEALSALIAVTLVKKNFDINRL